MLINGVGTQGKKVNAAKDFCLTVPYGWCYEVDKYASDGEAVFSMFRTDGLPDGYTDGSFEISSNAMCEARIKFCVEDDITVSEDATELDYDIEKELSEYSQNAQNISFDTSDGENEEQFYRMYKVVKNEPFLKLGYFTMGYFGDTMYNIILFTRYHLYIASGIVFAEKDHAINEQDLDNILLTVESLTVIESSGPEANNEQSSFSQPIYSQNNEVKVGALTMMLPDGYEYVTSKHVPQNNCNAKKLLKNYSMVAAPANLAGGLKKYNDAPMSINISKTVYTGLTDNIWQNTDAVKATVDNSNKDIKLNYVKEGKNLLIAYGKGSECNNEAEPYWVKYAIVVFCGVLQYTFNICFNSLKADDEEYAEAVETFCGYVHIEPSDYEKAEAEQTGKELDFMAAKNGRLKAVWTAGLYSSDIIFNNDDEIVYDGTHTIIKNVQINAEFEGLVSMITDHLLVFSNELKRLFAFVDNNEKLMIPQSKCHPNIIKATRGYPITGATFFRFCELHMIMIKDNDEGGYTVAIDKNLINGIPNAFAFVAEFIKTLRHYNDIYEDFEVTCAASAVVYGACGNISSPVKGAVNKNMQVIQVNGSSDDDIYIPDDMDENNISDELKELEKNIDDKVIDSLKIEVKDVKNVFTKLSETIKANDFGKIRSVDTAINKILEITKKINNEITIIDKDNFYSLLSPDYTPFRHIYRLECALQRVVYEFYYDDEDYDDEDYNDKDYNNNSRNSDFGKFCISIFENTYVVNAKEFIKNLCNHLDEITEEDIYKQFLERANSLIEEGYSLVPVLSAYYIKSRLEEDYSSWRIGNCYDVRISTGNKMHEHDETIYERVKKINIGDKVTLKREPDYEEGCTSVISVHSPEGIVGYLDFYDTRLLAKGLDAGVVTAYAEVIEGVLPKQHRNQFKDVLFYVKIIVQDTDNTEM